MIFTPASITIAGVAIVLAIGYAVVVELWAQTPLHIIPEHHELRLTQLDRQAIEAAYIQQITHLFQQWMKDEVQQPGRAERGANQARSAYSRAMTKIEQREKAK